MVSNRQAYIPSVLSFGPYHQQLNPELSTIDKYKLEAVHRTSARLQIDVSILVAEIHKLDSEIRECYQEPIDWDEEILSWKFLMDACFILEWFRPPERETDWFSIFYQTPTGWNALHRAILNDIMKLENQIPLFVLITLLVLEFSTRPLAIE
ncbi:hypothetical protein SUGI_0692900 [Cryptomeria japonica]|nr:hypothetical protein SUGI_0692900 [Cryptomeria japonica]